MLHVIAKNVIFESYLVMISFARFHESLVTLPLPPAKHEMKNIRAERIAFTVQKHVSHGLR